MGFTQLLATKVKKHLANIKAAHDRRLGEAIIRARRDLAKATTRAQREKVLLHLKQDKANLKRELYEARLATQKAETAVKKARREAGDLTFGERLGVAGRRLGRDTLSTYRALTTPDKPRRKTQRRATTKRAKRKA